MVSFVPPIVVVDLMVAGQGPYPFAPVVVAVVAAADVVVAVVVVAFAQTPAVTTNLRR